jgi:hypothetical protein
VAPTRRLRRVAVIMLGLFVVVMGRAPPIYVRVRVMTTKERHEDVNQSTWMLPNHTATDVLAMIEDIKPSMLERYFSGRINLSRPVPVSPGRPPMTVGEFLNASAAAGAHGCTIMPRISLWERLDKQDSFLDTARELRNLPLSPRMTTLGLDNWGNFGKDPSVNESVVTSLFTALHEMGWEHLSINSVGGLGLGTFGLADMADFGTVVGSPPGAVGAVPNWDALQRLQESESDHFDTILEYIDFSAQMLRFMNGSSPDQMAAAIIDNIANNTLQRRRGYHFVYPLVQNFWDTTTLRTSNDGRFKGKSLYKVMCENIQAAVADRPAKQISTCKLY